MTTTTGTTPRTSGTGGTPQAGATGTTPPTTPGTGSRPRSATPALPTAGAHLAFRPLPAGDARITGGFWALRQDRNGRDAIRSGYERLDAAGNFRNLRIAAGDEQGEVVGPIFMDSDVTKWLEAVAWEYGRAPAQDLLDLQREVTALYARAQSADGYVDSVQQVRGNGERYVDLKWSHELYCAGHLYQAAVAQHRATGDTGLLDVATRNADHLVATFGPGDDHTQDVDGHPVVESGLVELYRETGNRAYLDLAHWFVEARGHGIIERAGGEPTYFSDRVPVREATTVEGHAVRAVYLAAGAVDVAIETGDAELLAASERQFADMQATKAFITGGLGARWDWEAFGDPYELPTDRGYAETCAAIGGVQWAWRLLLATGKPLYADAIERLLYNAFLPGVSLAGTEYFYVNPLQHRDGAHPDENRSPAHGRRGWFDCACCPPNIMRTFASLDGYLATVTDGGLQVHQYADADLGPVRVRTGYPHDGRVVVTVTQDGPLALGLRIPAWSDVTTVTGAAGEASPAPGTLHVVERTWTAGDTVELAFDTTPHRYVADPRIDAARGHVAIERGPLVYAVEQADQQGFTVDDLTVDPDADLTEERREDLLDGVVALRVPGSAPARHEQAAWPYRRLDRPGGATHPADATTGTATAGSTAATHPAAAATGLPAGAPVTAIAVPYYAWANRGSDPMRVWLPLVP
ncbi:glycoside hydrolase family 127 protein [Curtobacterium oceanosedimentum]|uniref:glycoside hydrolase family 127 protein n=1 Tax=Curtobacterium oceanosedimentum TaxID=465820 RepID=UPI0009E7792A|nr:beta-L-arabinofuranosidase domain-containing protein [Curtobacterium oceanosedimentum]